MDLHLGESDGFDLGARRVDGLVEDLAAALGSDDKVLAIERADENLLGNKHLGVEHVEPLVHKRKEKRVQVVRFGLDAPRLFDRHCRELNHVVEHRKRSVLKGHC
eukprot:Amastigsp_a5599_30.p3 type:complete len:105 gc:universal Amastigsp_a5599_30:634-320(-)